MWKRVDWTVTAQETNPVEYHIYVMILISDWDAYILLSSEDPKTYCRSSFLQACIKKHENILRRAKLSTICGIEYEHKWRLRPWWDHKSEFDKESRTFKETKNSMFNYHYYKGNVSAHFGNDTAWHL